MVQEPTKAPIQLKTLGIEYNLLKLELLVEVLRSLVLEITVAVFMERVMLEEKTRMYHSIQELKDLIRTNK